MDRRDFLKNLCITGASVVGVTAAGEAEAAHPKKEFVSVLVDTTRCIGCRNCEVACATENDLPIPDNKDKSVFDSLREMTPNQWTVVNRFDTDAGTLRQLPD